MAVLGRGHHAIAAGCRLPLALKEGHPDNGSEFFKAHLMRFLRDEGPRVAISRPYHKNDNRLVEQKNDTLVRGYVGYQRRDTPAQGNARSEDVRRYNNLFQPVIDKRFAGGHVHRKQDTPQTPFQRAKASGHLFAESGDIWGATYARTNPRALRQRIYQRMAPVGSATSAREEAVG